MASAKKMGRKAKRSLKKTPSKKIKSGILKVIPRIHQTVNDLRQELGIEIAVLQKQAQKISPHLLKAQSQAQKANIQLRGSEEKMATGKGIVNKRKLKVLKSKVDKAEKVKVFLEKGLALAQKPLEDLEQELRKLQALEQSIKTFDKSWVQKIGQRIKNEFSGMKKAASSSERLTELGSLFRRYVIS